MKSRLLHRLWHNTLPDLGLDARGQQAVRELVNRVRGQQDPIRHPLEQILALLSKSKSSPAVQRAWAARSGQPVIVWTMRGGPQVNTTEAILAHALQLRGVPVRVVLCDEFLPACEQRTQFAYPGGRFNQRTDAQICDQCHFKAAKFFKAFDLPVVLLSTLVTPSEKAEIMQRTRQMAAEEALALTDAGIKLGGEIRASLNQFYRALQWPETPQTLLLLRNTAAAALMLRLASDRVLEREHPRAVLTSHGIYLLWGVIKQVAQQRGVPVTVWGNGYRTGTIRVSRGNWFEATVAEPLGVWESLQLTPERSQRLDEYLNNRWDGKRDRRVLFEGLDPNRPLTLDQLGLDPTKPTLGVFPNVAWDADLNFRDGAFQDMFHWLEETVRFFADHPQFQAVVRAHPGEAISFTSQRTDTVIRRAFPTLPPNVALIPAESKVNSYAVARLLRAAAVYGSQFGLELVCRGVPVLVASECFYRAKGFTWDIRSQAEYTGLLRSLDTIRPMEETLRQRARTYAYHYYFRRLAPFPFITSQNWSDLKDINIQSLEQLLPGRDATLDLIIRCILNDEPVVLNV